jgi:hypothetical protein
MTSPVTGGDPVPPSTSRPSARSYALNLGIFFAALAASAAILGRCLPFPEVPRVREKLEFLAKHGDDYDVLFVGSSQVNWQVMPSIFDRAVGEQGIPVRSFNAGIWGMMSPEDGYFLDEVLRRPNGRLRWVILELMPLSSRNYQDLAGTRREMYWHDGARTQLLTKRFVSECVAAVRGSKPFSGAAQDCFQSFGHWLGNLSLYFKNSVHLGRGVNMLRRTLRLPVEKEDGSDNKTPVKDGNDSPKGGPPLSGQSLLNYERAYANYIARGEDRYDSGDPASWAALRAKLDRLLKKNITPILIIPATVSPERYLPRQAAEQSLIVWDFSDPQKYPEFYAAHHRRDWVHLNQPGSEIWTEVLARRFVETMQANKTVP